MKILDWKEFAAMPEGTLYCSYKSCGGFGVLEIKGPTLYRDDEKTQPSDFFYGDVFAVMAGDTEEMINLLDAAEKGADLGLDFDTGSRDGLFRSQRQIRRVLERGSGGTY